MRRSIEEYIAGIECTVLVAENPATRRPKTYPPLQYRFPEGENFKHAKLKWVDYDRLVLLPVTDPVLEAKLAGCFRPVLRRLGGASFGRCDLRVDAEGRRTCWRSTPTAASSIPRPIRAAPTCACADPDGHEVLRACW